MVVSAEVDELRAKLDALARKTARTAVAADLSLQGHLLSAAELYDDARRLLEPRRDGEAGDRHAELCRQRAVLLRHLATELGSPGAVLEKAYGDESCVAALKTQQPPGRRPGATPPRGGGGRAGGQAMAGNRTLGGQARQGHWDSKEALAIPKFQCRLEDLPPDEASPQRQQSRSASPTRRQPEPCSSSPPRRAPSGASLRPSSTELAGCSLPNESHFVHSATAQLMQESHVPAVPSRGASLEARPAPHFRDNLSASTGAWVREVTVGMDAKALASNGALVPVALRLDLDQGMLHVAVPGDARDLRLKDIDEVLLGEEAHRVLEGRIPSRPSGDVCALQLHDGNCLALQLPPHVSQQAFAQHLLRVCQAERQSARGPPAGGSSAEAPPSRPSPPQAVAAPPQAVASTFAPSLVSMPSFTPPSVGSSVALASGAPAPGTAPPPGQGGLGSARGPVPAELVLRRCGTSPVMVPLAAAVPSNCWSSAAMTPPAPPPAWLVQQTSPLRHGSPVRVHTPQVPAAVMSPPQAHVPLQAQAHALRHLSPPPMRPVVSQQVMGWQAPGPAPVQAPAPAQRLHLASPGGGQALAAGRAFLVGAGARGA